MRAYQILLYGFLSAVVKSIFFVGLSLDRAELNQMAGLQFFYEVYLKVELKQILINVNFSGNSEQPRVSIGPVDNRMLLSMFYGKLHICFLSSCQIGKPDLPVEHVRSALGLKIIQGIFVFARARQF